MEKTLQQKQRENVIAALDKFIRQRPGMDPRNYGDWASYRAEYRGILKDKQDAERLLKEIEWRESISAHEIVAAAKRAFSGRLSITLDGERVEVDYCTGQYFPTEYRAAVCAVLSSLLRDYWGRDVEHRTGCADYIRNRARHNLGRSIANRWFR